MNVVDLLITIVVVTILVTIVLAVITYVAYKLRLARQPVEEVDEEEGLRYFVRFERPDRDVGMEAHATEA
jgi:heme/copper-type cytochrome/quinol oxidase subunit 2